MSQPREQRCLYVLLPWLVLLTLGQVAFFTFYFTMMEKGAQPDLGKMLTLETNSDNFQEKIQWRMRKEDPTLMSTANEVMTIKEDGYYFLCLTVTLKNDEQGERTVILKRNNDDILVGKTQNSSLSTGFLGKVVEIAAGDRLVVTVSPAARIDTNKACKTNLGIIYLTKHSPA